MSCKYYKILQKCDNHLNDCKLTNYLNMHIGVSENFNVVIIIIVYLGPKIAFGFTV